MADRWVVRTAATMVGNSDGWLVAMMVALLVVKSVFEMAAM